MEQNASNSVMLDGYQQTALAAVFGVAAAVTGVAVAAAPVCRTVNSSSNVQTASSSCTLQDIVQYQIGVVAIAAAAVRISGSRSRSTSAIS